MTKHNRFPPEVRERAICMVLETRIPPTYNGLLSASLPLGSAAFPKYYVSGSVSGNLVMMNWPR